MKKCRIDYDQLGRSYGTAIIQYEKPEHAEKAVEDYNGKAIIFFILIIISKVLSWMGTNFIWNSSKEKEKGKFLGSKGAQFSNAHSIEDLDANKVNNYEKFGF